MDPAFIAGTFWRLMSALPLTLEVWALSVALGGLVALGVTAARVSGVAPLEAFARAYVFVFRGTPLLVQVFLIYYGLGQFRAGLQAWGLWGFIREPYYCALLALTLNTSAYGAEIVRGGLQSVPAGQVEAARAFGMSGFTLLRRVTGPLALRQALPAYGNEIILMIKATSLASTITLMEVTGLAQKIIAETFRAVEVFLMAGAVYLVINVIVSQAIMLGERLIAPDLTAAKRAGG